MTNPTHDEEDATPTSPNRGELKAEAATLVSRQASPSVNVARGELKAGPASLTGEARRWIITVEGEPEAVEEAIERVEHALAGSAHGTSTVTADLTIAWRTEAAPKKRGRTNNRKITLPVSDGGLYEMPNIQNHGTRNLGLTVAGVADVREGRDGAPQAFVNGQVAAVFDLGAEEGFTELVRHLNPRTIKTMIAVSQLIWEKTDHQPLLRAANLRTSEVAQAAGYKPSRNRQLDPDIILNVARDLRTLSAVRTWAADGTWDKKTRTRPGGWMAYLLSISAIHQQPDPDSGVMLPYEFDALMGRNWAEAANRYQMVQVPPGFMNLEGPEILLGFYYVIGFRYRMTKDRTGITRPITTICAEAGIDPGDSKHRARFLGRLERWHKRLAAEGVIGHYERRPAFVAGRAEHGAEMSPGDIFDQGEYAVTPPRPVIDAYAKPRTKAAQRENGARPRRRIVQG
jgi:hypothetical protein